MWYTDRNVGAGRLLLLILQETSFSNNSILGGGTFIKFESHNAFIRCKAVFALELKELWYF